MVKISKAIIAVIVMFVAWKVTDTLLEVAYKQIDNAIDYGSGIAEGLLIALRTVVGIIGIDIVSFVVFVLVLLFTFFKIKEHD